MGVSQSRIRDEREKFDSDILPHLSSLLERDNLTVDELFSLFIIFTSMDKDLNGTISCNEFHRLLGIKVTLISQRMFLVIDKENTGHCGLHDFVLGVHELCHMTMDDLSALAFHIFDIDKRHTLAIEECDALLRMITGKDEANPDHLRHIDSFCRCRDDDENRAGEEGNVGQRTISLVRFQESVRQSSPCIVQPLLDIQAKISKVLEEWKLPN